MHAYEQVSISWQKNFAILYENITSHSMTIFSQLLTSTVLDVTVRLQNFHLVMSFDHSDTFLSVTNIRNINPSHLKEFQGFTLFTCPIFAGFRPEGLASSFCIITVFRLIMMQKLACKIGHVGRRIVYQRVLKQQKIYKQNKRQWINPKWYPFDNSVSLGQALQEIDFNSDVLS